MNAAIFAKIIFVFNFRIDINLFVKMYNNENFTNIINGRFIWGLFVLRFFQNVFLYFDNQLLLQKNVLLKNRATELR